MMNAAPATRTILRTTTRISRTGVASSSSSSSSTLGPQRVHEVLQSRTFASRKSKRREDPFQVLGIGKEEPYSKAKETFIQIAMSHHPDTSEATSDEQKEHFREVFIQARRAFEQLMEGPDGEIVLKRKKQEMDDFDAWFKNETGHGKRAANVG